MNRKAVLLIFATALIIRIFYVVFVVDPSINPFLFDDVDDYNRLANALLDGHGFVAADGKPTAWRPPLYPCFLAGIYALFGKNNFAAVQIVQALLGAAAAVMCGAIAFNIASSNIAGFVGGILAALNPMLVYYCGDLGTIAPFHFFVALLFFLLIRKKPHYFLSGIALGFAQLTRPTIIILIPVLLFEPMQKLWCDRVNVWKRFRDFFGKNIVKKQMCFIAGFMIVCLPWVVRNYYHFKKPIIGTTIAGANLAYSISTAYLKTLGIEHLALVQSIPESAGTSEKDYDETMKRIAIAAYLHNPLSSLRLYIAKLLHFFSLFPASRSIAFRWIGFLSFGPLLLGALVWLLTVRRYYHCGLLLLCALWYAFFHCFFVSYIRLRVPVIEPIFIVLTAQTVDYFVAHRGDRGTMQTA